MFKNIKRLFFAAFVLALGLFVFACSKQGGQEINEESCKDYCPAGETCKEANKENCKDFCEAGESCETCPEQQTCETCPEPETCPTPETCPECPPSQTCEQDFIAPTSFIIFDDDVVVGSTSVNELDEVSPKKAYTGVIWESSNPEFLTVDKDGVMTGIRPGLVEVTATSVLNPEVSATVTIKVVDSLTGWDLANREKEDILAQIPAYADSSFEFPGLWNLSGDVTLKYYDGDNNEVTGFVMPDGLTQDTQLNYTVVVTAGANDVSATFKIWATPNADDNTYLRLEQAALASEILLKGFTSGAEKVTADLDLPLYIYGVEMNWATSNSAVLAKDGKVRQPLDDRRIELSTTEKYLNGSKNNSFNVVVAGFSKEEKIDYILNEGSLANLNGGAFNTSLPLPQYDDKFDAKLTYKSLNPEIYGDDGALVAAPAEATEVKFEVTIDYSISKNYAFTEKVEVAFTALPANAASQIAESWLKTSGFNAVVHFPWGSAAGNILNVPTAGTVGELAYTVKYDVSGASVVPNLYYAEEGVETLPAFELTEAGQPKLIVQPLRYKEVQILATITAGEAEASCFLTLNIGISADSNVIYTGVWRSSDQGDTELSPAQGAYDLVDNASHFDNTMGYTKSHYGSGYYSGWVVTTNPTDGSTPYETFFSDLMYWEVVDDGDGVKADVLNLTGGTGGNWGWLMHNTSSKTIKLEVGTYSATGYANYGKTTVTDENYERLGLTKDGDTYKDAEGNAVTEVEAPDLLAAIGSRLNLAMDGYAPGLVADKDGNVIYGNLDNKLQGTIPDNRVKVGTDNLVISDSGKGNVINYIEVEPGGFAISWKYQFYGVGSAATVDPFCQVGTQLTFAQYDVHPANDQMAVYALSNLEACEAAEVPERLNINNVIYYYNRLSGLTKAEVFEESRLQAALAKYAVAFDNTIQKLLDDDAAGNLNVAELATAYTSYMNDDELLKAAYTKGAQLVALYEKYAAIDLKITYDYDGGYAQGFYSYEDKEKLMPEFLTDLYNFMVEKNAFQLQEQPTLETFLDLSWWSNYSKFEATDLSAILFTPYMDSDGNVHEDYMGINEEYGTFFNDPRYNKWVVLMDFVNEATQAGNMSGQDAWGRSGLLYAQYKYANVYKPELANADLTKYAGNEVYVTNKGTALGAYRFAQYVLGNIGSANHKYYIPHNYFSTIFDRQTTQERYGEQIYHCTDLTVKLYDDPYKEGYVFDGWYFVKEDGSLGDKAVVTGSLFKDLQVKAKWLSALESKVEEAVGRELTPIYYPTDPNNGGQYRSKYDGGTLSTQEAQVGIGIVGIVVGDNLFVMPKYALILLGQSATADYTIEVKNEETCPYGIDEAQDSTGIVLKPEGPTKQNSYGHGALYFNVSQFNITLADVTKTTYGRNLNGTGYGYDRFLFTPQEDGTYKAVLIGSAVGTALTLKPGEFLWCPMTAERWSVPLTDCDGTNGTVGVLSDGLTVQILNISEFTPAPSKPWTATKFYDGDELIGQFYLEEGESFTVPTPEAKIGFDFVGWATKPDASAEEVVTQISLVPTESVTYYAIYIEVSRFDELIINPGYEGTDPNVFKTFEEAFKHTNDNCVIKLVAGIYNESFTITTPMTIQGPNADLRGYWTRGDEATLTGAITINSDNVTLKGLHFGGDDSVYVTDAYNNPGTAARKLLTKNGINGFTFENNVVTAGRIFLSMAANTNTVIKNNFFNWTAETAKAYTYWRPIRMDGLSTDYSFVGNKVVQSVQNSGNSGFYDLLYFADLGGKLLIEGNDICMSTYNWMFNGAKGSAATEINVYNNTFSSAIPGSDDNAGWAFEALAEACVCRVIGNTFEGVAGTTFSYKTVKHLEVIANEFLQATYKPRINAEIGDGFVYNTNYVKADAVTAVSGYLAVAKDTATQDEAIAARRARFGVRTLEETWEVLFTDFAAFAGAADVATFKADYIAKTGTYDSAKELYTANKQGVIDDTLGTFAHSSTYGPKYLPFVDALDAYVNNVNDTQHAWSSTWTGLLRFREYLQGNEARVTDYRSQLLIDGLTEGYRQAALAAKAAAAASGTKVGEITLECKGLSMWTADYYGNYVYLFDGYKSGTYWGGIYLNKVYGNVYEVIATKVSGGAAGISACDVSIIYAENNATDYAAINAMGVQVGDLVSFDTDPVALENAKAFEAPLPVATVYRG